jgi:hypothetical protein
VTEQPYASAAAVTGLAREVEALRISVTGLPERVEEVAQLVLRLSEVIREPEQPDSGTVSWLGLPADAEPDEAESILLSLVRWLGTVYLRYADAPRGLPGCWLWHPDVVEELLWLQQAWSTAYRPGAPVSLAADWHDRMRPGVARRIRAVAGMCSIENHQPGYELHAAVLPASLVGAVPSIAAWWAGSRDGVPPAPTADQLATRQ